MKKKFLLALILCFNLSLVAYDDFDMDGVDDAIDKCPNSLLTDLVDINGCVKKSLVSNHHFDIILGVNYSQIDYNTNEKTDTISSSFQADYYYKKFSLQVATSYFKSASKTYDNKGQNDSLVSANYQVNLFDNLNLRVGAGVILPTYESGLENNNVDYLGSLNLSYSFKDINIFGGYSYTFVNDDDIDNSTAVVQYQDINALYAGLGFYPSSQLYLSLSYNSSDSIYKDVIAIENASVYSYYSLNENYFSTFSYAYGLSDSASDHYVSLRIGYYY